MRARSLIVSIALSAALAGAAQAQVTIGVAGPITGANAAFGVSAANKFVGDGVKFVIGHFNSGVTIPASDVYTEDGILFITPSATIRR